MGCSGTWTPTNIACKDVGVFPFEMNKYLGLAFFKIHCYIDTVRNDSLLACLRTGASVELLPCTY
jgi:hypothetical protein